MKKTIQNSLLALLFIGLTLNGFSQDRKYGKVEWEVAGITFAAPDSEFLDVGIGFYTEPRYNLSDNLSVGLRLQLIFFGNKEGVGEISDVGINRSASIFADYYIGNKGNIRPFLGAGFGRQKQTDYFIFDQNSGQSIKLGGTKGLALSPRVGLELWVLRFSFEYALILQEEGTNYFGFNLGLNIGGYQ